jgi:phosphoribosylformimino-5-aminoimidazole carboxamide ribotide isomerase
MILIPAVDIQGGKAVRLFEGKPELETVYFENPVEAAMYWQTKGAKYLHLVDLDAATGRGENREILRLIAQQANIPFEIGGGVRSLQAAKELLELGADRVVVGTMAIKEPQTLKQLLDTFGEKIVVSLDAKGLELVVSGWSEDTGLDIRKTAADMWELGIRTLIYTDVRRDGTLMGLDIGAVDQVRSAWPGFLIAGGGIAEDNDIENLARIGVQGAISGKAIYEHRIDLSRWF